MLQWVAITLLFNKFMLIYINMFGRIFMKKKMKNQKGFIQIPLLIAIIAGVLGRFGGGYLSLNKYQDCQRIKIEK